MSSTTLLAIALFIVDNLLLRTTVLGREYDWQPMSDRREVVFLVKVNDILAHNAINQYVARNPRLFSEDDRDYLHRKVTTFPDALCIIADRDVPAYSSVFCRAAIFLLSKDSSNESGDALVDALLGKLNDPIARLRLLHVIASFGGVATLNRDKLASMFDGVWPVAECDRERRLLLDIVHSQSTNARVSRRLEEILTADKHPSLRLSCVSAYARVFDDADRFRRNLVPYLTSNDRKLVIGVLESLGDCDRSADALATQFQPLLESKDDEIVLACLEIAGRADKNSGIIKDKITALASHENPGIQRAAKEILKSWKVQSEAQRPK